MPPPAARGSSPEGQAYAAACKAYNDYFRSYPPSLSLGKNAHEAVSKLKPPLKGVVLPKLPNMSSSLFRRQIRPVLTEIEESTPLLKG
jgi:hypothetical protein